MDEQVYIFVDRDFIYLPISTPTHDDTAEDRLKRKLAVSLVLASGSLPSQGDPRTRRS